MDELKSKLTTLKIFIDTDTLVLKHLNEMTLAIKEFSESLGHSNIKFSRKIGENNKDIGEYLISFIDEMNKFLKEYKEIKDTWGVTSPSSTLNDEK